MARRTSLLAAAMLAAPLGLSVPLATPAAAHTPPSATLSFAHSRVEHGTTLSLTYSSRHVPSSAVLVLQRAFGTAHVYKKVKTLAGRSGSTTAPGLTMGRYTYRIAVLRGKTVLATSRVKTVYSYGPLTLSDLCQRDDDANWGSDCNPGSIQVGSTVYNYEARDYQGNTAPDGDAGLAALSSACRSGDISFAISNDDASGYNASAVHIEVTQSAADAQTASTPANQVGSIAFTLPSSSWDVIFYTDTSGTDSGPSVFWSGTFDCWSTTGHT